VLFFVFCFCSFGVEFWGWGVCLCLLLRWWSDSTALGFHTVTYFYSLHCRLRVYTAVGYHFVLCTYPSISLLLFQRHSFNTTYTFHRHVTVTSREQGAKPSKLTKNNDLSKIEGTGYINACFLHVLKFKNWDSVKQLVTVRTGLI
jgi:hypothetical protein